jgi:hypothetical protein
MRAYYFRNPPDVERIKEDLDQPSLSDRQLHRFLKVAREGESYLLGRGADEGAESVRMWRQVRYAAEAEIDRRSHSS